jgi:hypothetical protein
MEGHRFKPTVGDFAKLHLGVSPMIDMLFAVVQRILFYTDLIQLRHREQWTLGMKLLLCLDVFHPRKPGTGVDTIWQTRSVQLRGYCLKPF